MASCVVVFGLVFLALGFLSSGISFCAPYWLYSHSNYEDSGLWGHGYCKRGGDASSDIGGSDNSGLGSIARSSCNWRWAWESDWAWERNKLQDPGPWFVATQGLFGFGVVILLFMFMMMCANLCCSCGKEKVWTYMTIGMLVLFAVLLIAAAMVVFGVFAWLDLDASVHSSTYRYNWAFYLGIAAVFLSFFSSMLFVVEGLRMRDPAGYERGDVV